MINGFDRSTSECSYEELADVALQARLESDHFRLVPSCLYVNRRLSNDTNNMLTKLLDNTNPLLSPSWAAINVSEMMNKPFRRLLKHLLTLLGLCRLRSLLLVIPSPIKPAETYKSPNDYALGSWSRASTTPTSGTPYVHRSRFIHPVHITSIC